MEYLLIWHLQLSFRVLFLCSLLFFMMRLLGYFWLKPMRYTLSVDQEEPEIRTTQRLVKYMQFSVLKNQILPRSDTLKNLQGVEHLYKISSRTQPRRKICKCTPTHPPPLIKKNQDVLAAWIWLKSTPITCLFWISKVHHKNLQNILYLNRFLKPLALLLFELWSFSII